MVHIFIQKKIEQIYTVFEAQLLCSKKKQKSLATKIHLSFFNYYKRESHPRIIMFEIDPCPFREFAINPLYGCPTNTIQINHFYSELARTGTSLVTYKLR
jgi:hypothetical protein